MIKHLLLLVLIFSSSAGCTDWIYRIDVPQGNYLDDRDIEKLRVNMTKEQVRFVLGNPVVQDSFDDSVWYYIFDMKRGMSKRGDDVQKRLILTFKDNRLLLAKGDFEMPDSFNEPLN